MQDAALELVAHKSTKLDGFIEPEENTQQSASFYSNIKGQRSAESIRRVLEGGKSKAYSYYLRSLRNRPDLSGTLVFEVVIEPDGNISRLHLISSELNTPELEQKILASVKSLHFGAKDVEARKITYKFNFLPS